MAQSTSCTALQDLADEVMMVVVDAALVERSGTCRLELPDQPSAGQVVEHHVHRLG